MKEINYEISEEKVAVRLKPYVSNVDEPKLITTTAEAKLVKEESSEIDGQEKIGICVRTGAGKCNFTMALLRIVEAAID